MGGGRMGKMGLEVFKLALYVTAPVAVTVAVVGDRQTLVRAIRERSYIVYPPEGPRPPSNEELWGRIQRERKARGLPPK